MNRIIINVTVVCILMFFGLFLNADENQGTVPAECRIAGLADSNVLALSWQPAFCEMKSSKTECKVSDPDVYQANNFALHGFWPNKKSCGYNYGQCGKGNVKKKNHCDYKPLQLSDDFFNELGTYMPSAAHGTCLQRHEWYKHGSCQLERNITEYYQMSIRLLKEFNESGIASYISKNIGKTIKAKDFFEIVDDSLGKNAHKRLKIKCYKNMLIDIYINLPKNVSEEDSLMELIAATENNHDNQCGSEFKIDPIGQNR